MNNSVERFTSYIKSRFPVEYAEMVEDYPEATIYMFFPDEWAIWTFQEDRICAVYELIDAEKQLAKDSVSQTIDAEDELNNLRTVMRTIQAEKQSLCESLNHMESLYIQEKKALAEMLHDINRMKKELNAEKEKSFDLAHRLMEIQSDQHWGLKA